MSSPEEQQAQLQAQAQAQALAQVQAEAQAQLPPAPTPEQQAVTDAHFRPVPLQFNPETGTLDSPILDLSVLNALIRSIASLPKEIPIPPPPNVLPPQRSMAITKAKDDGNAAYRKKDWLNAIRMYTLAVDVAASRPLWESNTVARDELSVCLANRSAAFAAVDDWIGALCDADALIKLKRNWSKGHYRKGKALIGLNRYPEARESFQLGLQFEPDNPDLKKAIEDLPK
ncbi:unnamed protein product [Tilletia laevis]|uniref:Uncharacterized protein n=1 Tax=Tilletia caries TaxID=13290 RepID=A0A177TAA6_9BASI|nr:hypothetical protein CF335_g4162 [Tilletia laevis]KAE8249543.1 hypothetical protein A4X03_0g6594 [Tilletia caries]CAD6979561.1 unnamed protein product [Tilletia controversa]KAE8200600.1 hypothetical protein CF336_g617 [Tilletia laevis]CAD6888132.1 unnamed protein product [Tilletia caries]